MPNYVYGTNGSDILDLLDGVTNGADVIYGYNGNDFIWASGGADTIYAGNGDDYLNGGSGNDLLVGGNGADQMNGGSGTDMASYDDSSEGVTVSLASGEGFGGTAEGDTLASVESITGSWYADMLIGDDSNNVLAGLGGNDTLKGGGGADTLYGDSGNDMLKGGGGADTLNGGAGIDTANYAESSAGVFVSLYTDDAAYGDAEGDELNSIENLTGSAYADDLWGSDGVNVLSGLDGNDSLKGFGGDDTLTGGDGSDFMDGGAGADTMNGGLGNDVFIVDNVNDVVIEASFEGNDVVRASTSWTLQPGVWVETLETTSATGTSAINLTGNGANNTIIGNDGANVLDGAGGADQMTGRDGNDTYIVNNASDAVTEFGGEGADTVRTSVSWTMTAGADVETLRTTNDAGFSAIDLTGNSSGNIIIGNNGANFLNGGDGNDELSGLGSHDVFVFNTALNAASNVDMITDFDPSDEYIYIDNAIFSSLGAEPDHFILSTEFQVGAEAGDADDRIIYDDTTGAIYYDMDGTGAAMQVQFAEVTAGTSLAHDNFHVF
jgi:Ca2+-binding RTX toxin-like protein